MWDPRVFLIYPDGRYVFNRPSLRDAASGKNKDFTARYLERLRQDLLENPWLADLVFDAVKDTAFNPDTLGHRTAFEVLSCARSANPAGLTDRAVVIAGIYLRDPKIFDKSGALKLIKDAILDLPDSAQHFRPAWATGALVISLAQTIQSPNAIESNKHLARESLTSLMRFGPMRSLVLSLAARTISSFRHTGANEALGLMPFLLSAEPKEAPKAFAIAVKGLQHDDLGVRIHALRIIERACHLDPELAGPALGHIVPLTITDEPDPANFTPICAIAWDLRTRLVQENPDLKSAAALIDIVERDRLERKPLRRLMSCVARLIPGRPIPVPPSQKPKDHGRT